MTIHNLPDITSARLTPSVVSPFQERRRVTYSGNLRFIRPPMLGHSSHGFPPVPMLQVARAAFIATVR